MINQLDSDYWNKRYVEEDFPWDLGKPSPPLQNYYSTLENKNIRILIPGAGNGYEAAELNQLGFKNVFLLDWSDTVLANFRKNNPEFPSDHVIQADFFDYSNQFDLILEQTFFCALYPALRTKYVVKMMELLVAGGKLCGVLFDFPLTEKGPPFGGSPGEYIDLFSPYFSVLKLERCPDSEPSREGKELFLELQKS